MSIPLAAFTALAMIRNRLDGDETFRAWADSHLILMGEWLAGPDAPDFSAADLLHGALVGGAIEERGTAERRLRRAMVEILEGLGVKPAADGVGALGMWSFCLFKECQMGGKVVMGWLLRREIKEMARRLKDR